MNLTRVKTHDIDHIPQRDAIRFIFDSLHSSCTVCFIDRMSKIDSCIYLSLVVVIGVRYST